MSLGELAKRVDSNTFELAFDEHEFSEVAERYGEHYTDYLFDPTVDSDVTKQLLELRDTWREDGATVIFTSGAYDLIHHDHKGYLLHTKLAGAANHYARYYDHIGKAWDELTATEKRIYSDAFVIQGELRLIVSVDGDNSVAARKGNKAEKGDSLRPITGWLTRARSVVDVTQPLKGDAGWTRLPVADAVTIHGPEDFRADSPHASLTDLAALLQPDVWIIFEESEDLTSTAPHIPALGSVALKCIRMGGDSRYFTDPILGKFSTTAIVQRAKGES